MRISLFSWLFVMSTCLIFPSFCISVASEQCLDDQRALLLQLKNSVEFDVDSSRKLVKWNQTGNCCSWEGVTCREGRVIGLDLQSESIYGRLDNSSRLFSLQYLQYLNLAYNDFYDQIPSQFGKLTNLNYLNLANAGFRGQIPIAISNLTRLVTLDLSLDFSSRKLELENPNLNMLVQNLSELVELYLDGVNIPSTRNERGRAISPSLSNLRVLSLSHCSLSGPLDSSIAKLQSLSILHLNDNNFDGPIPESFADFKNLTSLDFSFSELNGKFPENIFQIPTLQMLDLSYNYRIYGSLPEFPLNGSLQMLVLNGLNFSGTLPHSIGNLKMLSQIDLRLCNFIGSIPESIASLTQLQYLDLSYNYFVGSIPSFTMGKNLTEINLSHNNLTGQITSTRWEELLNLVTLDFTYNSLEGSIPISLFFLPSLPKLGLSNNRFSGPLNELLNVSSCLLRTLDLSHNNLDGRIPISLFFLPSLQELTLSNNRLSGQLNEFSNVSSYPLKILDLSRNNLEGTMPMLVFQLRSLETLSLSWNNFHGSLQLNVIPTMTNLSHLDLSHNSLVIEYNGINSSLFAFPQITTLSLASNKLKTFPYFLLNLSTLEDLDLSDNQIHGQIPNWIWKNLYLVTLNLSYNYLETLDLPSLNMSLVSVSVLDLHSNQLQGQLSVFPKYAKYLDFSKNYFSFVMPTSFGNSLTFLSLSSNEFYGSIPRSICNATYLRVLDLSDNFLSGTIPRCLIEMNTTFGVLNLRKNNLNSTISDTFPSNCCLQTLNLNGNRLEGKLPKSLATCTSLKVLDLGNNHIEDAFPCYLKNISMLHVIVLRSNKFYGPIDCPGSNASWPMLQIVDLARNNFSGKLPIKSFSDWKIIMDDKNEAHPQLNHLQYEDEYKYDIYYQDVVTVTFKGLQLELVKILNIFTSLDFSCNNFGEPIPEEIGELKSLYILNLSHNAFTGQIPSSLGKLSHLESLDLSSNELVGKIPLQLANGLIFLSVLDLSFNQLVGQIPLIKQFATFSKTSYEGNSGLCGFPLKEKCMHEEPQSSPPTLEETHLICGNAIDWNFLSAELGFVFGFGIVILPLMFWKRWRICYYKHVDDMFFKMFPYLYIIIENCQRRAHKNQGRRAHKN